MITGRPPRVLHLRSSAGVYGAERVLLTLLPALPALGIEVVLGCLRNPYQPAVALHEHALAAGVDSRLVRCDGRLDLGTVAAIRALADETGADLLHVHDYKGAFHARLANRPRRPLVATMHGQFADSAAVRVYNWIERRLARGADRICVVSDAMRGPLERAGVPRARTIEVPNGVDIGRFRPADRAAARDALGLPREARVFGTAMRLLEVKDPLGLVTAFARADLGAARLAIAGDGPLRTPLQARIDALGLGPRVRLLGVRDDLERVYPAFDAFVLPSRSEGLPMALLEAMACGVPPIASAVGRVPEALAGLPQGTAATVPPGDAAALAAALAAFAPPPGAAEALRARVLERFSSGALARAYAEVYRGLVVPVARAGPAAAAPGA
ncbi:MAG: hypothetical protein RJA99_560 [Pseudomonadota bacterium]|jgi:glycosyltransferase involved in cell wall biosynthesis